MARLLIVEDEKNIAELTGNILSPIFSDIFYAKDGESGLKKFKKIRPDLVICDILMPISDGLTLAKNIKKISPNTPIIIISAHSDKEKLLKAIDVNVNKYLIKPIIPEELLQNAKKLLKNIEQTINIGNYTLDLEKAIFNNDTKIINLSKKELALLKALCEPIGKVLSIEEIKNICWNKNDVNDGTVRTFIKRFRDKLEVDMIKNITSIGYKINIS